MRVALLHDVTRSAVFGQGGHNRVAAFWQAKLAPVFAPLGCTLFCPEAFADDAPSEVERLRAETGLPAATPGWLRLFSDPALLPAVQRLVAPLASCDLVLGWELSPNIVRALLALGVPIIDMSLAPLRFAPDLYLRLRSSDAALAGRLKRLAEPSAVFEAAADRLRAALATPADPPESTAGMLFVGQTDLDASLIENATLASTAAHHAQLHALLRPGEPLLIKPHPHGQQHADIAHLHQHFPQARIVTDSVYRLLCAPALRGVVTLSSSVAEEARWFGKTGLQLIEPDHGPARLAELGGFHVISAQLLTTAFWATLLADTDTAPEAADGATLRRMFSLNWGWPPQPLAAPPIVAPDAIVAVAGSDAQALGYFGWQGGGQDGLRSTGRLAILRFACHAPHDMVVTLSCRAQPADNAASMQVALAARPGDASSVATLPADMPCRLSVRVPAARAGQSHHVEIALRLESDAPGSIIVSAMQLQTAAA